MVRVFISSVQKEFSEERKALAKYIREDALLRRFFEPFIFEELPAINLSASEAYLAEAAQSEIYLGIFGKEYGYEDADGVSSTEGSLTRPPSKATIVLFSSNGAVTGIPRKRNS